MSDAEMYLWVRLRRHQIGAVRFRRQVPIGPYIADFASHAPKLVARWMGSSISTTPSTTHDATPS